MRLIQTRLFLGFAFLLGCASSRAGELLSFDASSVPAEIYVSSSQPLFEHAPLIAASTSPGYTGLPVYCGFQMEGRSLLAASKRAGAGLKIRWNNGKGLPGESCSGLFVFKCADVPHASPDAVVAISPQAVAELSYGYMNPGLMGPNEAIKDASLRFVFKDDSGFYISAPTPVSSTGECRFNLRSQTYFTYNPTSNTSKEVGISGAEAVPTFQKVEYLGFRLDAIRGSNVSEGANIGVVRFSVQEN